MCRRTIGSVAGCVDLANALTMQLDELASGADVGAAELVQELQQAVGVDEKTAKALEKILTPKRKEKPA
jgi:hypothetical protein